MNDVQFVEALYKNIGGNAGDAGGIQYWVAQLTAAEAVSGATAQSARASIVGAFVDGILSIDLTNEAATGLSPADYNAAVARQNNLMNKVTVSQFYADQSNLPTGGILVASSTASAAFEAAQDVIESVSNDNATVATAKTAITQAVTNQSLAGFDNLAPVIKQTFTLTVDQDIFTTGTGNDLFLAPIGGIFGFQPTLTPFDTLIDSGKNNALQAFFAGSLLGGPTIVGGLTIQGIQTWQFENAGTTAVLINGGVNVGGPGPSNGGAGNAGTNPGVTTITIINSSAGVAVGGNGFGAPGAGTGLANLVQTVNVANITGGFTKVVVGAGQFTGTDPIALNIANLPAGYSINIGPDSGTTGYQTWNIMANDNGAGATVDTISLGAFTATNAKTINLSDGTGFTGGLTLNANTHSGSGSGNWANVVTVNGASLAGVLTVTGAENGSTGFLAANTAALKSITGGAGGSFFDLTAFTASFAGLTVNGGGTLTNEVDFNSDAINAAVAFAGFSNEATLGDADTAGGHLGGTVDMTFFPGVSVLKLMGSDGLGDASINADFNVKHAPNVFDVNFQNANFNGFNFNIFTAGSSNSALTVDFSAVSNSDGIFASSNYNTVTINGHDGFHEFFGAALQVEATVGSSAVLNINAGTGGLMTSAAVIDAAAGAAQVALVGMDTLTVVGGTILAPTDGTLNITGSGAVYIGVTNASVIDDTGTGALQMRGPEDTFVYHGNAFGDNVTADGAHSILQGSLGLMSGALDAAAATFGYTGATSGTASATSDFLTDTAGSTAFYGDGGGDSITQGSGSNTDYIGTFFTGHDQHTLAVVASSGAFNDFAQNGFWGVGTTPGVAGAPVNILASTSNSMTTITGFWASGAHNDVVDINLNAWQANTGTVGNLVADGNGALAAGTPTYQEMTANAAAGGTIAVGVSVVAYDIQPLANAAALAAALDSANTQGAIFSAGAIASGAHMLFAYTDLSGGLRIADVNFETGVAAGASTNTSTNVASDVVDIAGSGAAGHTTNLLGLVTTNQTDIHFSTIGV